MNIYDNIDEIIYINLESRNDRDIEIRKVFDLYFPDKKITRVSACTINNINLKLLKYKKIDITCTPGVIGCYYSHIIQLHKLYEKYKNTKKDTYVLIFEDDTNISPEFINKLKEPFTLKNWNIILGINDICNINKNEINLYETGKYKIFGTNIIIYNLKNIKEIYMKMINLNRIKDYDFMLFNNIDNLYFFDTKYIFENKKTSKSDIRNE